MSTYDVNTILSNIAAVPEAWIYKFFYHKMTSVNIKQPFDGRTIKVKSILNRDSEPSLCFFCKNGHYFWRDFSGGNGGNCVSFVAYHYNKYKGSCIDLILRAYEEFLVEGGIFDEVNVIVQIPRKPDYKLNIVEHNLDTIEFYEDFKIDLNSMNKFKVKRLGNYSIIRGSEVKNFKEFSFAYFNSKGCYQIYQPRVPKCKYINIDTNYLIGSEQLEFRRNVCIIQSGLKDIQAIDAVELSCEYVAPPSENTLLSKDQMEFLKSKFAFLLTMFDNDPAGIKAMRTYERVYNIPYVHIPSLKKDTAENNKNYSLEKLKYMYTQAIHKKINMR